MLIDGTRAEASCASRFVRLIEFLHEYTIQVFGPPSRFVSKGFVWSTSLGVDDNAEDGATYLLFNVRGQGLDPVVQI
jgi:hypothetical protein